MFETPKTVHTVKNISFNICFFTVHSMKASINTNTFENMTKCSYDLLPIDINHTSVCVWCPKEVFLNVDISFTFQTRFCHVMACYGNIKKDNL